MKHTDTVIIGGGQAGLAMSRCLLERGIDHIVLEKGRIAQRWRDERWDSLRLLSPNWMARLPHYSYQGSDPDGFMTMPEFIRYLESYAESFEAPIQTGTTVELVERISADRLRVATNRGKWSARNVVIATGFCDVPRVPSFAQEIPSDIEQMVPSEYRRPSQLPDGNVLIVGASATGAQIADELNAAGREVTLAVGTHVRLPRRYRGRDILSWMVDMGAFRAPAEPAEERLSPPPQLVGGPDNRNLDLGELQAAGVHLVGRATAAGPDRIFFADDLAGTLQKADTGLQQLLGKIDGYIEANVSGSVPPAQDIPPVKCPQATDQVVFEQAGINSIIWATGYERKFPWLKLPILDERGDIRHEQGITPEAGVVVLGMRFQITKGSNLIDGVGADAKVLADYLATREEARPAA
jgi:putative flavoprotein involved in K+ transport